MVFLFLIGTVPLFVFSGAVLSAYKSQAVTRLGNDVSNQCQILATQIGSTGYLDRVGNETLAGELMQMATLNDGRIIIIDQDLQIVEDTYELVGEHTGKRYKLGQAIQVAVARTDKMLRTIDFVLPEDIDQYVWEPEDWEL